MPVEFIETTDPLTAMVQFRTSTVYEMLVSLNTLLLGQRHLDWVDTARAALGDSFVDELREACGPFWQGCALFEFGVDYHDHHDVPGFIEYVRNMDADTFLFYLIGRIVPPKEIAETYGDVHSLVQAMSYYPHHPDEEILRPVMQDVSAFQKRITGLWERYWTQFFQNQIGPLRARWAEAIAEKERLLTGDGARLLLEMISTSSKMPDPIPADHPWTEIVCVPVYYISSRSYKFFG